jgi:hypothetical protein
VVDQVVDNDAWLAQAVGGSTQYGNGTGTEITIGPAPSATPGNPDFKGRGVFEVDLTTVFSGITSVTAGSFIAKVAGTSCIGTRGSTIRILLEELTVDFGNKSASGTCGLSSATNNTVWNISNNINTADRAFHSSGSHSAGDELEWDITDLLNRKLSEGATVLRFRLIACNSDGSAYDEATAGRRIQIYSVRHATSGNRPKISVTGSAGAIAKGASDSFTFAEGPIEKTVTGSGTAEVSDIIFWGESALVEVPPVWSTIIDGNGHGIGQIYHPTPGMEAFALLSTANDDNFVLQIKFKANKKPLDW